MKKRGFFASLLFAALTIAPFALSAATPDNSLVKPNSTVVDPNAGVTNSNALVPNGNADIRAGVTTNLLAPDEQIYESNGRAYIVPKELVPVNKDANAEEVSWWYGRPYGYYYARPWYRPFYGYYRPYYNYYWY